MRIHKLQIQAFGPFAGSEEINFDELADGGLFLLDGPTGAGKSSILDAICYALYGSLPGSRAGSRQIRSDHAPADLTPEVVCELTIGDRRFEVTRSPAWMRPSKRGKNKTTEQKAASLLREFTSTGWNELSTRNDEVGHVLGSLLGLDRDQFTKVVMLPQGGFADFLRAKAKDREELLANLFDTSDYAKIEEEFAARLAAERKNTETLEARLSANEEAIIAEASAFLAGRENNHPADDVGPAQLDVDKQFADYRQRIAAVHAQAEAEASTLRTQKTQSALNAKKLEEQRRVFARLGELRATQTRYAQQHDAAVLASERLDHDAKATAVQAYWAQVKNAQQAQRDNTKSWEQHQDWLKSSLDLTVGSDVSALAEVRAHALAAAEELAVAKSAVEEERKRSALATQLSTAEQQVSKFEATRAEAEAELEKLTTERHKLEAEDLDQVAAGETLQSAKERVQQFTVQIDQANARDDLEKKVLAAREKSSAQELKIVEAEKSLLALRTEQLNQSALRLAASLQDGEPCLVCGSAEHPAPAKADAGAALIDDEQILEFEATVTSARVQGQKAAQSKDMLIAKFETAQQSVGEVSVAELCQSLNEAQQQLEQANKRQTQVTGRVRKLETLRQRSELLTARVAQATLEHSTAQQRTQSLAEQLKELDLKLDQLRQGKENLAALVAELSSRSDGLAKAVQALQQLLDSGQSLTKAESTWLQERVNAGFESFADFDKALLDATEREQLRLVQRTDADLASAISTLEKSEDCRVAIELEADGKQAPHEEQILEAVATAQAAEEQFELARERVVLAQTRLERHDESVSQLHQLRADAGPVIESYRRLRGLAEVIRGGGENLYKMTLSTYVLAARLEEVAVAATERLDAMSGGRYSLHHDDSKQGNAKSGLGLRVLDSWTGKYRETQTLSGGETFMASLALALGLADVISHHSGAVDMQTLFVDEGFGSLDAETLEEVMQALENLRAGGRTIGLVSHVAEMKQRITNRVSVLKTQHGSTIHREGLLTLGH